MPRKVRDYKDEYDKYHSKPDQVKKRAQRNAARADVVKKVGKAAVAGKDVDHKKPISKGGGNASGNLQIKSKSDNRSFARTKNGSMK